MDSDVCLIRKTILIRGMSQDDSGLPRIRPAPTLASIPLVHLRVSERKIEWHERSTGPEPTPGPLNRDAHVPCGYHTVNHPSSGQNLSWVLPRLLTSGLVLPTLLRDWHACSCWPCRGHLSEGTRLVQ